MLCIARNFDFNYQINIGICLIKIKIHRWLFDLKTSPGHFSFRWLSEIFIIFGIEFKNLLYLFLFATTTNDK